MTMNEIITLMIGLLALFAVLKVAWTIFKFIIGIKIIMWTIKFLIVCFVLIIPVGLFILKGVA